MANNERVNVVAVVTMLFPGTDQLWDAAVLDCKHWVWIADHDEGGDHLSFVGSQVWCDELHEGEES